MAAKPFLVRIRKFPASLKLIIAGLRVSPLTTLIRELLTKLKPILTVLIIAPWLWVIYWFVSDYGFRLEKPDLDIVGSFIEWFGTAYSLFLALVLANAWSQYDTLDREFDQELDSITALYDTVNYVQDPNQADQTPPQEVRNIYSSIQKYVNHVIKNYEMEGEHLQQRRNGDMILEGIGRQINSLIRRGAPSFPEPVTSQLLNSLNTAIDVRGDRISHSKQRIPQTVWLVAVILSILWLLPFLVLRIEDPAVKAMMKLGIAFIIVIVLTIISDLNQPFEGTWKIDLDSWKDFLRILESSHELIFVFRTENNFADQFKDLIGRNTCKLSKFSRGGFFGDSWRRMLTQISNQYPGANIRSVCIYADQFKAFGYGERISVEQFPSVIRKVGDEFAELMNSQEINGCRDLAVFQNTLSEKLG